MSQKSDIQPFVCSYLSPLTFLLKFLPSSSGEYLAVECQDIPWLNKYRIKRFRNV